jgi:hypothetical protein
MVTLPPSTLVISPSVPTVPAAPPTQLLASPVKDLLIPSNDHPFTDVLLKEEDMSNDSVMAPGVSACEPVLNPALGCADTISFEHSYQQPPSAIVVKPETETAPTQPSDTKASLAGSLLAAELQKKKVWSFLLLNYYIAFNC